MQVKKFLATLIAVTMSVNTAVPFEISAADTENYREDNTPDEAQSADPEDDPVNGNQNAGEGTADNQSADKQEPDEQNTAVRDADGQAEEDGSEETDADVQINEEFLQIISKTAVWDSDGVRIELISGNTDYNKLYIGSRTDEKKDPVIEGILDEDGRYHYVFCIDPQYLGAEAAYVPCNAQTGEWYDTEDLYMQLPADVQPNPAEVQDDETETDQEKEPQTDVAEDSESGDGESAEGMISPSDGNSQEDSMWKIDDLENTESRYEDDDFYRIDGLEDSAYDTEQKTDESGQQAMAAQTSADGTYQADAFTFEGGTGKTKITCENIVVQNGMLYATVKFSSEKFTRLVVSGTEYQPVSNQGGSYFKIPVRVNEDMEIMGTTVAMGEPHDITYMIHITKKGLENPSVTPSPKVTPTPVPTKTPAPKPTATPKPTSAPKPTTRPAVDLTKDGTYNGTVKHVSGTASMFKIIDCKIKVKKGKITATITLNGTGYDRLFLGTKENALKAKDSSLIPYKTDKNGKYTYEIPLTGLNKSVKIAARSHRYYEAGEKDKMWYDHTLNFTADIKEDGKATPTPAPTEIPEKTPAPTQAAKPDSGNNGTGSGGSTGGGGTNGTGGSSTGGNNNSYSSKTDGQTSQVDSSAGGLKDGEYGSGEFSFSWEGGTGTHGLNITCDKISVENGQAWAYVAFNSGKWVYLKASGGQYDPTEQDSSHTTFKIPVQLNANNKVVGCTTAMSKPYEIEYTLYFGMDIPDSTAGGTGGGSSKTSVSAKSVTDTGSTAKVEKGEEAQTDAGTVYMDEDAPKITGLEYLSSLKLEHSRLFKIHYYSQNMTILEIYVNEKGEKTDTGDLKKEDSEAIETETKTETDIQADSESAQSNTKLTSEDGEEGTSADEQDYAKLYKQDTLQYLLVPEDKKDQIPAGIDKSVIVVELPVDKSYIASDIAMEMIDKIDADKNIAAVSATQEDCKVDNIEKGLQKGNIISAGTYDKVELKSLVKAKCNLAVVPSDVLKEDQNSAENKSEMENDTKDADTAESKDTAMTELAGKFAILKIPMIIDRSKDEKDTLAKYEWSKVYGALFGCEKEASQLYEAAVKAHEKE